MESHSVTAESHSLVERKRGGAFYTAPAVVKLMVRLALANYLANCLSPVKGEPAEAVIENLVYGHTADGMDTVGREVVRNLLKKVKVLDPAVGQGAFLTGMMEELLALRCILGEDRDNKRIAGDILAANLYGVDRDAQAVTYCRRHALSNVVCGDSLVDIPPEWEQFDIVLANPPYVRQEFLEKSYKRSLVQYFREQGIDLKERSDLYVYFFARLGEFLKDGGTAAVISASAWLDVDYGAPLQKYLLENYRLRLVMESACERWFREAGVNTNIVLLEKGSPAGSALTRGDLPGGRVPGEELSGGARNIRFVQLKGRLQDYISLHNGEMAGRVNELGMDKLMAKILRVGNYRDDDELRIYPVSQEELLKSGMIDKVYRGTKWGKYLRAPEVFFRILDRGRGKLCTLGELAEVRFGIKTGCNEFFYLKGTQWAAVETEYLLPVVKSPREVQGVKVEPDKLNYRLLTVSQEPGDLQGKRVWDYIIRGQEMGYHLRPSIRGRNLWYCVERNRGKGLLFRRFFHDKFNIPLIAEDIGEDQTFYRVAYPGEAEVLGAVVNSTVTALFVELSGRLALGEGVLQFAVYEAAQVLVANPERITTETRKKLRRSFANLSRRDTGTIFEEVLKPDRRELDLLVLEILGFRGEEAGAVLKEVYRALTHLVSQRIARAQTHLTEVTSVD